jgi:hypothetical protein
MGQTNLTALDAISISIAGTPVASSPAPVGPVTTFDRLDASGAILLGGVLKQGTVPAGITPTQYTNINVLQAGGLTVAGSPYSGSAGVPTNTVAPALSTTSPTVGSPVSVTTGTWTNSPTGYAYQWFYADTSTAITGATSSSYTPVSGDIGHTLLAAVTASNTSGSGTPTNSNTSSAVASAALSFTAPYNFHMVEMGDSRVAQGFALTGVYGTGTGRQANVGLGPVASLGALSGHQLRYTSASFNNAGGAFQTIDQILASPRSGSNTIDLAQVAASEAATVVFYMGTNNNIIGVTQQNLIINAIAALTNPATVWTPSGAVLPLYQGRAKNVIFLTDTPRGVTTAPSPNDVNNAKTGADLAAFAAYALWLKKFDYASGDALANSRVLVADTFYDPRILNVSSGTLYSPNPGLFADGLHDAPTGNYYIGRTIAERIAGLIVNPTPYAEVPVSSTASTFLNSNPLLAVTGAARVSFIGTTGPKFTGTLFTAGTVIQAFGTGGTTGTGSNNGTYSITPAAPATITGGLFSTPNGNGTVSTTAGSNTITVSLTNGAGTIAAGDTITGAVLPDNTDITFNGTWTGLNLDIRSNVIDATNGNEYVFRATGTSSGTASTSPSFTMRQYAASGALSANDVSTSTYRATANLKFTATGANMMFGAQPFFTVMVSSTANSLVANGPLVGARTGYGANAAYTLALKNNYVDLGGSYLSWTTPTVTGTDQSITAGTHPTVAYAAAIGVFQGGVALDATLYVRNLGLKVVTD